MVCIEYDSLSAMVFLMLVNGMSVYRTRASGSAVGKGTLDPLAWALTFSKMSSRTIRPAGPDPFNFERSTLVSLAIALASGVALTLSDWLGCISDAAVPADGVESIVCVATFLPSAFDGVPSSMVKFLKSAIAFWVSTTTARGY